MKSAKKYTQQIIIASHSYSILAYKQYLGKNLCDICKKLLVFFCKCIHIVEEINRLLSNLV